MQGGDKGVVSLELIDGVVKKPGHVPGFVAFERLQKIWLRATRYAPCKARLIRPSPCPVGAYLGAHFEFFRREPSIHAG